MADWNPLTQEHCDTCTAALRGLPQFQEMIDKCISCGMPFEPAKEQAAELRRFFESVKSTFFPHQT